MMYVYRCFVPSRRNAADMSRKDENRSSDISLNAVTWIPKLTCKNYECEVQLELTYYLAKARPTEMITKQTDGVSR